MSNAGKIRRIEKATGNLHETDKVWIKEKP